MEHHSNIVPWQMLCAEKGAALKVVPVTDAGELDLDALERLLGPRTRLLAVTQVSNALGTVNPLPEIVARARARGVPVLVDGAQGMPHLGFDVARRRAPTSTPSAATSCTDRPASACSGAGASCSRRCRRGRAAAT